MLMNRLSPLHLLQEMQNSWNWLDELTSTTRPFVAPEAYPAIRGWSDDENFYVEAELPGMSLDELEILMADGQVLTIKGERKGCPDNRRKWLQREQGYGSFQRQIRLPGTVDQQKVEAELMQGVLTIMLPKAEEIKPQRIPVKGT
ncbi:MAG TPA: Hsp20/alpha crystallin family protein [Planctomicrobium sp.]|nr:Hsp20/alpha crystallin family protein [Planctomicrobium sp.]